MALELKDKGLAQVEAITSALQKFGEAGASIEQIKDKLTISISERTLQRRLKEMQGELGLVTATGGSHARRYHLVKTEAKKEEEPKEKEKSPSIPLTAESQDVLTLVSRPNHLRTPVGYQREFLEFYEPNVTSYLTPAEAQKLFQLGQVAVDDHAAGTYAKEILQRLLIDLSYNSSRLEGNTYSLLDTERLIHEGEFADNKSAMETQMILNHKDAIEFIVNSAEDIDLNRYTILNLHAMLSNNLLPNPAASGRLRAFQVGISKSVYTPLAIPQLIEEMFELILEKARRIKNPFEQAFFIMVQLPYLQPFEDVNKRVSRLAANIPLNRKNLAPLSFIDVPDDLYISGLLAVYELNRVELLKDVFIWSYERSAARYASVRQSLGEPDLFRMKYRQPIRALVAQIVSSTMDKKTASKFIEENSNTIPAIDRKKFIEYTETELLSLHEGNFARFMITPSEFRHWYELWSGKKPNIRE